MDLLNFIPGYSESIYRSGREPALIMFVAFLLTFVITRGYTRIARKTGWGSASFGGVHTHHLVFGLVLAIAAGAAEFAFLPPDNSAFQLLLAATFGTGAALVLDEFALVFHLDDVYWEKEGRKSVDAVVIAALFGVIFLLHIAPLGSSTDAPREVLSIILLINLCFVMIAAVKGKIFLAIFGVFVPLLAFIGAIRLAEPSSIWAKKLYSKDKMKRSAQRYTRYEKVWRTRKEAAWDLIGGKEGRPVWYKKQ